MIKPHLSKKIKKSKTMQDRIDRTDESFTFNAWIFPCSKIAEEETTY